MQVADWVFFTVPVAALALGKEKVTPKRKTSGGGREGEQRWPQVHSTLGAAESPISVDLDVPKLKRRCNSICCAEGNFKPLITYLKREEEGKNGEGGRKVEKNRRSTLFLGAVVRQQDIPKMFCLHPDEIKLWPYSILNLIPLLKAQIMSRLTLGWNSNFWKNLIPK